LQLELARAELPAAVLSGSANCALTNSLGAEVHWLDTCVLPPVFGPQDTAIPSRVSPQRLPSYRCFGSSLNVQSYMATAVGQQHFFRALFEGFTWQSGENSRRDSVTITMNRTDCVPWQATLCETGFELSVRRATIIEVR
jgi:hypothetical protein